MNVIGHKEDESDHHEVSNVTPKNTSAADHANLTAGPNLTVGSAQVERRPYNDDGAVPAPPAGKKRGRGGAKGGAKRGAKAPAPQSTARTPAPKKRGRGAMGTDETDENVAQDDPPVKRRRVTGGPAAAAARQARGFAPSPRKRKAAD
ncbi:hypothetical protein K438DRAFT_1945830 [Mycena galopus ATCC 62051]|nr:hypothetical protein K438DRAFT_1945830 [Mycena galopus ATCC 62051]